MKKSAVLKHFVTGYRLAKQLGVTEGAISRWGPIIPELRARQIEDITGGALKFEPRFYRAIPPLAKPH